MSVQSLDIISVNIWQILISLANLLIMFLILKRFLFKPVQKVVREREEQVTKIYGEAEESRSAAMGMKQEYEARLASAREEADGLVRNAVNTAQRKSDQIVNEASAQASRLKQKAEEEIAMERKQMLADVRGELSDIAVSIASKVVEREIQPKDHEAFMDEFIKNVGEQA
ncbi:MAG: F0F1 ATP synthase subunit B [Clostridiales bacterium]|nr:F0F1 ATP synthase subunit B [Clostridiales bacterium]MDO4351120.1 F0F1 ATP synthase subunit B [Eubacteriales bacterium]MDY4008240.1 F0F1 ATP synthase subunit B [Candidatus Limiplasma sp.]